MKDKVKLDYMCVADRFLFAAQKRNDSELLQGRGVVSPCPVSVD